MCPDQPVQRPFLLAHGGEIRGFERRDDAVVRRHLAVVPGARALGAVELAHDLGQRGIGLEQAVQDRGHFGEHAFGQVARIRARVRRGLVRLVQGLGDLQGFLHVQPKLLGTDFLQGAQVEQQRRSNSSGGPSRTRSVSTDTTWALPAARICCAACCATGCRRQRPASSVLASGATHCAVNV